MFTLGRKEILVAGGHISTFKPLRSAEQVDMVKDFFYLPSQTILLSDLSPIRIQDDVKQQLLKVIECCEQRHDNKTVNMELESKMKDR